MPSSSSTGREHTSRNPTDPSSSASRPRMRWERSLLVPRLLRLRRLGGDAVRPFGSPSPTLFITPTALWAHSIEPPQSQRRNPRSSVHSRAFVALGTSHSSVPWPSRWRPHPKDCQNQHLRGLASTHFARARKLRIPALAESVIRLDDIPVVCPNLLRLNQLRSRADPPTSQRAPPSRWMRSNIS